MKPLYTADLTVNDITEVLRNTFEPFIGIGYQAQDNRVQMPLDQFNIFTPITFTRLSTTTVKRSPEDEKSFYTETRKLDVQLDIYGQNSAERAIAIETIFRSGLAYQLLTDANPRIIPLYSSTAVQASMINAEAQWQDRYLVMLTLQVIITITAPQAYFNRVDFSLYEVDTETLGKPQ